MSKVKAYSYIRMSTKQQLEGHSYDRQIDLSEKYAEENDLEIVSSEADIGVSAYRGLNTKDGSILGEFLASCEKGNIDRGSVLIVENLDRLSRQNPYDAIQIFQKIINCGVKIVTLMEKLEYTEDELRKDPRLLDRALGSLERAHQESKIKSERLSQKWIANREKMAEGTMQKKSRAAPQWLRVSNDELEYIIIPERQKIIIEIFHLLTEGLGAQRVAKKLNARGEKPFTQPPRKGSKPQKTFGWSASYISKLARERKVLGEHQMHKMEGNKRVPIGEPIQGYFPAIIDEELFLTAKKAIDERAKSRPGRQHQKPNVLQGLTKCECGSGTLYAVNKSPVQKDHEVVGVKEYHYLRCRVSNDGTCTVTKNKSLKVNYDFLLTNLMGHLVRMKRGFFKVKTGLSKLERDLAVEENLLTDKNSKFEKFRGELYERGDVSKRNLDFLEKMERELDALGSEVETKREKLFAQKSLSTYSDLEEFIWSSGKPIEYRQQQLRKFIKVITINASTKSATVHFVSGEKITIDVSTINEGFVPEVFAKANEVVGRELSTIAQDLADRHPEKDQSAFGKKIKKSITKQLREDKEKEKARISALFSAD
jgi:DNA invertase Pin-like site-specific DNA recombinase